MKNTQKGFVVPLLVGVIALLVIAGGYYVLSKKSPLPPEQPISPGQTVTSNQPIKRIEDPSLVDWKVCRTHGLEMKYPKDWKIWQSGNAELGPSFAVNSCNITSILSDISPDERPKSNITLDIWDQKRFRTILNPPKFNSLDDWFAYARPIQPRAIEGSYRVSEIFGEHVVWTGNDKEGFKMYVFHNQTLYMINFYNVDSVLASKFINSINFTEFTE